MLSRAIRSNDTLMILKGRIFIMLRIKWGDVGATFIQFLCNFARKLPPRWNFDKYVPN